MKLRYLFLLLSTVLYTTLPLAAQGPQGRDFGFGISLGEPLGATVRYWLDKNNSIAGSIGGSFFGSPRLQGDYLWHFDVFRSAVTKVYAGPGVALGFGKQGNSIFYSKGKNKFYSREDGGIGIGIRIVAGIYIIPRRSPIEIFAELAPLIGLAPSTGTALDVALGIRFYP